LKAVFVGNAAVLYERFTHHFQFTLQSSTNFLSYVYCLIEISYQELNALVDV